MGFAIDVTGSMSSSVTDNKLETLKKDTDFNVTIKHFDAIGYNGGTNEKWEIIPPAELTLTYKQSLSVAEDFDNSDITLTAKPIDIIIGFDDIEKFIGYATNLLKVMKENQTDKLKAIEGEIKSETEVKPVQTIETKPLTNKAIIKVAAKFERLGIIARNNKAKQKHSLARACISNFTAKMNQETIDGIGIARDIDTSIGTFQCQLDQFVDFIDKKELIPFM
jgi:hypothetical protein